MEKSLVDRILREATKLPNSLRTVLDETEKLYSEAEPPGKEEPKAKPKKRRKTDIRTIRRRGREIWNHPEKGDNARQRDGSLRNQFFKLRREVKRRRNKVVRADSKANWDWELTLAEWLEMWMSCPLVEPNNVIGPMVTKVPAWKARGRSMTKDVQLKRIDFNLPWRRDNIMIVKGKEVLWCPVNE